MNKQSPDPVIDEVRAARHVISARFGHDARRLVAHYLERQEKHHHRLVGEQIAEGINQPTAKSE